jgi:hypothetical protein
MQEKTPFPLVAGGSGFSTVINTINKVMHNLKNAF